MRFRNLLLLEVLPRFLDLPDHAEPRPGENPSAFLLRLADEGVAKGEWPRVARALDAYRATAFGHGAPAWLSADLEACQSFIAARKLDEAHRFAAAISAYQRALRSPGRYSPADLATTRLAALEKEQPAAFAEALKEDQLRELMESLHAFSAPPAP